IDFSGLNGAIANRGTRQEAVSEGDRVNEWLEGRSNLPIGRSESAIEFALRIIASANQRTNPAAGVIEHYHRPFKIRHGRIAFSVLRRVIIRLQRMMKIGLMLNFCELRLQRLLRRVLHVRIDGGVE